MIKSFSIWLASTSASGFIAGHAWITPLVQSIHILAIATLSGAALMIDTRLLGITGAGESVPQVERRYGPWFWWALVVLLASGLVLVIGEPDRELLNILFRLKMVMVLGMAALLWLLRHRLARAADAWDGGAGRWLALGLLALWLAIVSAGRWIAYV